MKKTMSILCMLLFCASMGACSKGKDYAPSTETTSLLGGTHETQDAPIEMTLDNATDPLTEGSLFTESLLPTERMPIYEFVPTLLSADYLANTLPQIYEVDASGYGEQDGFNHLNVISSKPITTQERPSDDRKQIQLGEKILDLTYCSTRSYPIGDLKTHEYLIDGTEGERVLLKENGGLYFWTGNIAQLDIAPSDAEETVLATLKSEISGVVDLEKYQYMDVERSLPGDDFGFYKYTFYNAVNGYVTDFVFVGVLSNGTVSPLCITEVDPDAVALCGKIDADVENEVLLSKLIDIYNTDRTAYIAHEIYGVRAVQHDGTLCIYYTIGCEIRDLDLDIEVGAVCDIMIPVQLLLDAADEAFADRSMM